MKTHLSCKNKVKWWNKILQANSIHRKEGIVMLISDKIDFKITKLTRDKDGHFIMIKETLHQENIILLKIYAPTQGAPKYINQLLRELQRETNKNTLTVRCLNIALTALHRSSK